MIIFSSLDNELIAKMFPTIFLLNCDMYYSTLKCIFFSEKKKEGDRQRKIFDLTSR